MKVLNRVKEFADSRGLTAYALWKATRLSEPTVYRLYKDPTLVPSGKVLEGFAEAFPDTSPNDWLRFEVEETAAEADSSPQRRSSKSKKSESDRSSIELQPGQFVLIPSGMRAWVDRVLENGRVAITCENGLKDDYPVHLLTVTDVVAG